MGHRKGSPTMATTTTSAKAWSPDLHTFLPSDVIPEALLLRGSTVAGVIEGDEPSVRVPWINDAAADFVAEGATIPEADPTLDEVTVSTAKVSQLVQVSREQYGQGNAAALFSESVRRAVVNRANTAFMTEDGAGINGLTGVLHTPGVHDGGNIAANLDPLADVLGLIEEAGGSANLIVASPSAWSALRKLKTGDGANSALLGAGTEDTERRLFGVEVVTSAAVSAGSLAVIDSTAVASAAGSVQVATSLDRYFENDAVGVRATWRLGWAVQHADRLGVLTVGSTEV